MHDADANAQLAPGLNWPWSHSAHEIWRRLDPELWELTANPWLILRSISKRKLDLLSEESSIRCIIANHQDRKKSRN